MLTTLELLPTGRLGLWIPQSHRYPSFCLNPTLLNTSPSSRQNDMKTLQQLERFLVFSTGHAGLLFQPQTTSGSLGSVAFLCGNLTNSPLPHGEYFLIWYLEYPSLTGSPLSCLPLQVSVASSLLNLLLSFSLSSLNLLAMENRMFKCL